MSTSPSLSYRWEPILELADEGADLIHRHWLELGRDHADVPLDPDWERYADLEDMGFFRAMAARADGVLIGYVWWLLAPNLHYRSTRQCEADIYWVDPAWRRGRVGIDLFRRSIEGLPRPCRVLVGEKVAWKSPRGRQVEAVLRYLGFDLIERHYSKLLKD